MSQGHPPIENWQYILHKKKWEKEGNFNISKESWRRICKIQWNSTGSTTWREFCRKNIVRFFTAPLQQHLEGDGTCWRLCGENGTSHYHTFWECQVIIPYWQEIHKHINNIFGVSLPFRCDTIYMGEILFEGWNNKDKKMVLILLAASKKAITRKWIKSDPPTPDDWIEITNKIYISWKNHFPSKSNKMCFLGSGQNELKT